MEYLEKASEIAPGDARIPILKRAITGFQATWLNNRGIDSLNHAQRIYRIYDHGELLEDHEHVVKGRKESRDHFLEAMKYFLAASECAPSNTTFLSNIADCAKIADWISWSTSVNQKIQTLKLLTAKQDAQERLPQLREELARTQDQLSKLKSERGFLSILRIKNADSKIRGLQARIATLEKLASF